VCRIGLVYGSAGDLWWELNARQRWYDGCVMCPQENSQTPDTNDNETLDQDELIDVISLHDNQCLSDDLIDNGSSAATQADLRTGALFHCDIHTTQYL